MNKKDRVNKKFVLLGIILLLALAYFVIPSFNSFSKDIIKALGSLDLENMVEYLRSYGNYTAVISFIAMILQSLIAPIPAFLITLSNAAIFGWVKGAALSWASAMAGASLCFYIAKILGRDVVEKLTSKTALNTTDNFFKNYGKYTIVICRLLPFVPFDIISYAAGLTSMSFVSFFIATGIGQLPATIVYSYVGQNLTGNAKTLMTSLLVLFSLAILTYMIKQIYNSRQKKKLDNE